MYVSYIHFNKYNCSKWVFSKYVLTVKWKLTRFMFFLFFKLRPPTVIGQFHTLFFGSVRMFFLGVLGFAVYGNEALHFSCEPDKREVNLFCYNQFRPITPQVRQKWNALQWTNRIWILKSLSLKGLSLHVAFTIFCIATIQ